MCFIHRYVLKMESRNILYIVGGAIITVLVIILIATICLIGKRGRTSPTETNSTVVEPTNEIPINFSNALVVQLNYSDLWALDIINGDSVFVTRDWSESFSSFDFYKKKTVYFASSVLGKPIRSLSNAYPHLNQPGVWNAEKIAVDDLNANVYAIDGWASKINIFDIFGEHYSIVVSDLNDPKDIALDSAVGVMFILQLSSILKANMDGTSPETLITRTGISAFAIERDRREIYWSNVASIESTDYAGNNSKIVTKLTNIVSSLAVLDDKLFWLYPPYGFEDSILWSCTLVSDVCSGASKRISIDNAVGIKAYKFDRKLEIANPCKREAEGCQHMCILSSKRGRSCACTIGWQLKSDCTNCRPVDDFLLYVQGNFVKGRILNLEQNIFIEAMLPIKLLIESLVQKRAIDFDYDARNHALIFSDDWDLNKIDLKAGGEQIRLGADVGYDMLPAIDWVTKNLYYIRATRWEGVSCIAVRSMNTYSTIEEEKLLYQTKEYQYPKSLVVHPNRGWIFFTIYNSQTKQARILRMNSNGSGLERFGKNLTINVNEAGLAIDYSEDRLYWFSADKKKVYRANLDESDLSVIDVSIVKNPRSIGVYKEWMYITNLTSVWRLDKNTGNNPIKIVPKFENDSKVINGAKIFSQNLQYISEDHPCAIGNGGCERFCFAIPGKNDLSVSKRKLQKVCGCKDTEILQSDGKSCFVSPSQNDP
ncbi:hypothetical protein TSAR_006000 [Trichomalopsis sarcophagae]|uniref:EGF-like domain-containing protein n=1 Tax=Trichomalopsis sarcophagae TaxID=543379 RepID=A0A232F9A1_9HYME|nr:hypothetical protein TSAR_006000 [Trichomalopsis sarcophagae]